MYLGFYGTSGEGRPLPVVVVSREKAFTGLKAQRLGKPIVLIQNGIHAGEIDGKDASLMLLRDLAAGRLLRAGRISQVANAREDAPRRPRVTQPP